MCSFFSACSGQTFGNNCSNTCDCVHENTLASTQSCNHVTGVCECLTTWNGSRCEKDIDECAVGTSQCGSIQNQGCYNTEGSFKCSCFIGYEDTSNGGCDASKFISFFLIMYSIKIKYIVNEKL